MSLVNEILRPHHQKSSALLLPRIAPLCYRPMMRLHKPQPQSTNMLISDLSDVICDLATLATSVRPTNVCATDPIAKSQRSQKSQEVAQHRMDSPHSGNCFNRFFKLFLDFSRCSDEDQNLYHISISNWLLFHIFQIFFLYKYKCS